MLAIKALSLLSASFLATAIPTIQLRQTGQTLIDFTLYTDDVCNDNGDAIHVTTANLNSANQTACIAHEFRSLRIDSVENGGNDCTIFVYESIQNCNNNQPTGSFTFDPSHSCDSSSPALLEAWKVIC